MRKKERGLKTFGIYLIALMLLAGCAPKEQLIYSDKSLPEDSVARLRVMSAAKVGTDPYKLGVGSKVVEVIYNGKAIAPKGDVVQLEKGNYLVKVIWWRITKDTSMFIPAGAGLILVPGGSKLESKGTYDFEFNAKPGFTYVVDVQSTVEYFDRVPESLCLTEEAHYAPGVTYPAIGKAFRYPSENAEKVSCVALSL